MQQQSHLPLTMPGFSPKRFNYKTLAYLGCGTSACSVGLLGCRSDLYLKAPGTCKEEGHEPDFEAPD